MPNQPTNREHHQRLTVAGSFGYGNAGDEGAWMAVGDLARQLGHDVKIDVLSRFDYPASRDDVIGLNAVDVDRRIAIASQPLLFVGGGTIEPNVGCSLLRISRWMHYAGVSYAALFGASVETGRRYNWSARRRLQAEAKSLRHLFVRDVQSQITLSEIITDKAVQTIGDVVLCLEPADQLPPPIRELRGARYIAVNLAPRWNENPHWHPWIASNVATVAQRLDAALVFVPCTQQHDRDQSEHDAVSKLITESGFDRPVICLGDGSTPREIAAAFGGAVLTIGMRLHACIMSYARCVPWVALAYHPKLSGFAATVEQLERVLPPDPPSTQAADMYGYTFSTLNLADCDMERAAMEAIQSSSFHMLEPLKLRLAHALSIVIQENAPARASVAEGVPG